MIGYWFFSDKMRDGRPIPKIGEWLVHEGDLVMCESGLHSSEHPFDALIYAPGNNLALVESAGKIIRGNDKIVAEARKILKQFDATDLLQEFARKQALSVIRLWDTPDVVREYLTTGNESLRDVAEAAAWAAAQDAAEAAAAAAARAAARNEFKEMVDKKFEELK